MARSKKLRICSVCHTEFLSVDRATCSQRCYVDWAQKQGNASKRVMHFNEFLPADSEENLTGTWAPSPEDISEACVELQMQHYLDRRAES